MSIFPDRLIRALQDCQCLPRGREASGLDARVRREVDPDLVRLALEGENAEKEEPY